MVQSHLMNLNLPTIGWFNPRPQLTGLIPICSPQTDSMQLDLDLQVYWLNPTQKNYCIPKPRINLPYPHMKCSDRP